MSRKIIILNLALLALAGLLVWTLRLQRLEERARERGVFERAARAKAVLPPPPMLPPKPVLPSDYLDVAQKMLFSKDRNPTVVVDPPPVKPEPPLPPLPAYFGQMAIGEPVVFLSTGSNPQKSYHVGEKIGPFELVSFDQDTITLDWNGKTVERKLQDLAPKEPPPQQQMGRPGMVAGVPVSGASSNGPGGTGSGAISLAPTTAIGADADKDKDTTIGANMGGGFHGCVAGDNSPNGTIKDGYKKVISQTLFGQSCHWEQVK